MQCAAPMLLPPDQKDIKILKHCCLPSYFSVTTATRDEYRIYNHSGDEKNIQDGTTDEVYTLVRFFAVFCRAK